MFEALDSTVDHKSMHESIIDYGKNNNFPETTQLQCCWFLVQSPNV